MDFLNYLLIITLITQVAGQLLRFKFLGESTAVTPTDIIVILLCGVSLFYLMAIKRSIRLTPNTFIPVLIFTLVALSSNFLATLVLPVGDVIVGSFFLIRFIALYFISQIVVNVIPKSKVNNWVNLIIFLGTVFIFLGFLQLVFYPDLTALTAYGWDPHQRRIVSTFLDPNYAGFIYVIIFSLATSYLLFNQFTGKTKVYLYLCVCSLSLIATVLTFSRSSYLALLAAILIISAVKSLRLFILMLVLLTTILILVPQARTRIIGAISIDETARARIQSWENALFIFQKSPILGVGYNTYRFTQARYDLFSPGNPLGGNSGSGSDSSILLIAATTGIVGLIAILVLVFSILKMLGKKASKNPITLAAMAIFAALLVHTQFVNSFFYPQIMLLVWFIIGLSQVYDS
jgi:O-antigen ligase